MTGLIHTGLGSSSLIAHVLHSPPPPPVNSFIIGPAVINTHTHLQSTNEQNLAKNGSVRKIVHHSDPRPDILSPRPWRVRACGRKAGRSPRCLSAVRSWSYVDSWAGAASGDSFRVVAPVTVWGLGLLLRGAQVDYGNDPAGWSGVKRICWCLLNRLARRYPGTGRCLPPPHASLRPL